MNAPALAALETGPSVSPSRTLAGKLAAVRRMRAAVDAGTGLSELVAATILLLAGGMILDWMADLPSVIRALVLASDAALLGLLTWFQFLAPLVFGPDEDASALMVERAHPEFQTRLIAAVQLTRPQAIPAEASPTIVRALVHETERMADPIDFSRVVSLGRLPYTAGLAALLLAAGLAAFAHGGDTLANLLRRAFLSNVPVPRKTRVECLSGSRTLAMGDPVSLEARARGHIPTTGRVRLTYDSGRLQEFTVEPAPRDPTRFVRLIENVQDSFRYIVYLNDGRSEEQTIRAVPRPAVAFIECQQTYPAYTKEGTVRRAPGDLMLLAGSRLHLKVTANKDVQSGQLRLAGLNQTLPLTVDERSPRFLEGEIPIPAANLTGFSVYLTDRDGLESRNPAVYRIDIIPDRPPAIRMTYPDRREELVTAQARMIVGFEASDDYAIGRIRLRYKIDRAESGTDKAIELDLGGETPKTLRRRFEWHLPTLRPPPPEGSTMEYWIEVQDNNNVTGPGVSATDHYVAKVVDESEKRADLMRRLSEYLSTLTDVTHEQEQLSEQLGQIILEKKPTEDSKEGDDR